jgi:phosphoserine phosphatase
MKPSPHSLRAFLALAALLVVQLAAAQSNPLPAWNDGPTKQRIVDFVRAATTEGGKDYVPPPERIAVFDNDGTLWPEQPMYAQLAFALDRADALAPEHADWKRKQPFRAALSRDMKTLAESGEKGMVELITATHAGMTTDEFRKIVRDWLATAKHPRYGRPYTELAYPPMLELLAYLRANGFKTYIVSGGGVEFMRVFAEEVYGVPPEQVIGSTIETRYDVRRGEPGLVRLPELDFIDDGPGKPVGIHKFIGRRPIAAFGNSDGDFQMLEYVSAGEGPRLAMIVHHDDGAREYAYDRKSPFGKLDRALDASGKRGWTVVSMKNDWRQVFRTPQ